jgi:hypothetical protein
MTEHVRSHPLAFIAAADVRDDSVRREIKLTPDRRRKGTKHEQVRAGVVGDDLRSSRGYEVGVARVGYLDREMEL